MPRSSLLVGTPFAILALGRQREIGAGGEIEQVVQRGLELAGLDLLELGRRVRALRRFADELLSARARGVVAVPVRTLAKLCMFEETK